MAWKHDENLVVCSVPGGGVLQVIPVPCLSDNYAYLVIDEGRAAVVDPSQADPVLRAIHDAKVKLSEIWLTHHHWDHIGGIEPLIEECPIEHIRGSQYDADHQRIPRQTDALSEGDSFDFGRAKVDIMEIPGHTLGAIAFIAEGNLFSGDTLFIAGCGRVFEGTMAMMSHSLSTSFARYRPTPRSGVATNTPSTIFDSRKTSNPAILPSTTRSRRRSCDAGSQTGSRCPGGSIASSPRIRFCVSTIRALAAGRDPVASFTALRDRQGRLLVMTTPPEPPATWTRDENGIPQIAADDINGLHWGMGYCHAMDRGMQMLIMRILGQGRAAELLDGSDEMVEVDRFFRRMNWSGGISEAATTLSPEAHAACEAYCDGVNARFSQSVPWELKLVRVRPEPWTIEDSCCSLGWPGFSRLAQSQGEVERLFVEMVQAGIDDAHLEALFPGSTEGFDRSMLAQVELVERIVPEAVKWWSCGTSHDGLEQLVRVGCANGIRGGDARQ